MQQMSNLDSKLYHPETVPGGKPAARSRTTSTTAPQGGRASGSDRWQ